MIRDRFAPLMMTLAITLTAVDAPGQAPLAGAVNTTQTPDYSKEAFIIEKVCTVARFENDGTSSRTVTSAVRVQSEAGVQQWGVIGLGYSSANEQVEIAYVRVHKVDGAVVETPADNVQDVTSELTRMAPMYSDYHEKHVTVKGLGVGDVLEYQVTTRLHTPLIPGQFWYAYDFGKTNIALDEEVEVNVPKDREVKVKSPDLKPAVREEGKRRIYSWKTANRERKEDEELPREVPPPAILVSTFKSWEEVGRWWNDLEQERVAPTPEIRAKADELTRGATTREDKARAIYNYVATQFRYISISFGIGRYQPHAAVEVLKNQYGDCKDKHTLLASLLAAAGIESYPALVNALRQIDPEVPSPGQFNHVVSAVPETPRGNKLIWLDTTTEVAPFGFLTFNLRDKQALLIPAMLPALLVTTPAAPPFKSFASYEIDAKLSDAGVLEGRVQRSFRGDSELLIRLAFRQVAQSQWKDLVQGISRASAFAGDVSEVEAGAPEATAQPYHFSYKYTRKDYPDWANHRIMPPVGFIGFADIKGDKKRTQPIFLGPTEEITAIAKVELPKGYTPRLLSGIDLVRDFAEYHSSYTFKDDVLVTEVREVIKKRDVPLSALDDYISFQKAVSDDLNRYTELSHGSEPASAYVPTPSPNEEATSLAQQAREAFRRHDLDGASDSLERALKLDDHYKDAWVMLATLCMTQGRTNEALAAFRKAIDLDPRDTRVYRMLGFAYVALGRPGESIPVWRELLKQDPNDGDAHANLGNFLLNLKRYGEAVPELEAAVALSKSSPASQLALANAYLGAGNTDKAAPTFKKAAEMALRPVVWNDVAYALADHNLSLPDAQRYAEKAVKSVQEDTARVSLATLDVADLRRMVQLAAFWDTLGWVYFRQGDLDKAQKYLEASWNLEQSCVVGEHLAQVYEKQGRKVAANHQHALAGALPDLGGYGSVAVQGRGGGSIRPAPGHMAAVEELSEMRRSKLGKLPAKQGSAEFFVLLAPGGRVADVKFITGDEHIRPLSKTLASVTFKAPLPDDAPVKLVRRGVLVCMGGAFGCDFTLFTIDSVQSTQ